MAKAFTKNALFFEIHSRRVAIGRAHSTNKKPVRDCSGTGFL
jgi:hypothetical protein